jgi:hypothetical protein
MAEPAPRVGHRVWFPVEWEEATLDSVLTGGEGQVIAYVLKRDDGTILAIDAQMRTLEDFDGTR